MRQLKTLTWIAALAVLCLPVSAQAATATLRHLLADPEFYPGGYAGYGDNTIFYYSPPGGHAALPEKWMRTSDGSNNQIKSINAPSHYRNLIRFDLSAMSGQSVDVLGDATLTFTIASSQGVNFNYSLYQIAQENAGWQESTNNTGFNPTSPSSGVHANNGDPTWFYKSIDATLDPTVATAATDTTSTKWFSQQASLGPAGSNPEGYANTGGLWNWIDLVDQDPVNTPVASYLDMANGLLEPVATSTVSGVVGATVTFTIPEAMIQSWIDNPAANAGLLGRNTSSTLFGFWSKDTGTAANRPTLTFDYSKPVQVDGDFDGDGDVDANDLNDPALGWKARYGTDLDGSDFLLWQQNYGFGVPSVAAATAVPEPTALSLLFLMAASVIATRRQPADRV